MENLKKEMPYANLSAIWAAGKAAEMNKTYAFVLDTGAVQSGQMYLTGASCYKIFADGKQIGFGPNRAAHGYCRISEFTFSARYITVEAYVANVRNFCWIKQPPFFACEVQTAAKRYCSEDFACYELTDRVQKVQRYSFQRGFTEVYEVSEDRRALYFGGGNFPKTETERVRLPKVLPSRTANPLLEEILPCGELDCGSVEIDCSLPVWEDRSQTLVGSLLDGFLREEWQAFPTDEVSRFKFVSSDKSGGLLYATADFSRIVAGFIELDVLAENAGEVYVVFDEILSGEGQKILNPFRGDTANAFRWTIKNAGKFCLASFEPYAYRYARVICSKGIAAKIKARTFENPEIKNSEFSCSNGKIGKIMQAARNTFAHNAVDLLTDCPSRERAGWLSDSYFSSEAERIFTGDNKAERAFLENFIYADKSGLPEGMIPRCYPADYFEKDGYIPNWALWYILELHKYFRRYGADGIVQKSRENVEGILHYFSGYENEYGAIEDLGGWVFVEWSEANRKTHTAGVNVPTNACYCAALLAAAETYGFSSLIKKAERIKKFLNERAYADGYYADNLVRDENNELISTENYTETCQYYALYFRLAAGERYKELFKKMIENYGKGKSGGEKKLAESNMMYGVYMRLDLLMREGMREELLNECIGYFYEMAEQTGTLWEKNAPSASCDHGFASYAAKWLVYADKIIGKEKNYGKIGNNGRY